MPAGLSWSFGPPMGTGQQPFALDLCAVQGLRIDCRIPLAPPLPLAPMPCAIMPDGGVDHLWFAFIFFSTRAPHAPQPKFILPAPAPLP